MKYITLFITGLLFGATVGYLFANSENNSQSEEIISREISLLNKYKNIPSCDDAKRTSNKISSDLDQVDIIYWHYSTIEHSVKKVIISPDMFIAYEESPMRCE